MIILSVHSARQAWYLAGKRNPYGRAECGVICCRINNSTQTKSAHAEVVLPDMSAFLAAVKFFALDLSGREREGPDGALLIIQFLARLLAELFAGDKFRHEVHSFPSVAIE